MEQNKKMTFQDLLAGNFETYITEEDVALIQNTFKDNMRLLKVLRKILLPSIGDSEMPIEQMEHDVWMVGIDWSQVSEKEAKSIIVGRDLAIKFVMGGLRHLKILASEKRETAADQALRFKRNSNR